MKKRIWIAFMFVSLVGLAACVNNMGIQGDKKEADEKRIQELNLKEGTYAVMKITHGGAMIGDVILKLYIEKTPVTAQNFIGLVEGTQEFADPVTREKVKKRFYDGLIFHRVIENFMIQGGDPLGRGTGGPGYSFKDEIVIEKWFSPVEKLNEFLLNYALKTFKKYIEKQEEFNRYIYAENVNDDKVLIELDNRYCKSYQDKINRRAKYIGWRYRKSRSVLLTLTIAPSDYNDDKYLMWIDIKKQLNRFLINIKYYFKKQK